MKGRERGMQVAAVAAFLVLVFIAAPWMIAKTGRTDLYYALSSVALLAIASGGVWLTFYIGRINSAKAPMRSSAATSRRSW